MDCLKRFRRQKPLLVGKLAVVCMQIALWRQNKRVGNYVVIKFMQRKTSWGLGRGIAPSSEIFSILSLKMATFSAFWVLAHAARRGGMAPPGPLGSTSAHPLIFVLTRSAHALLFGFPKNIVRCITNRYRPPMFDRLDSLHEKIRLRCGIL